MIQRLREVTDAFAADLDGADLDRPVAACPGWDVRALADHLGGVHAWAAHAVTHGSPDLVPPTAPVDGLVGWYREQAAHLIDVVTEDGPAWAMDPANTTTAFWRRRQVHETRMHLWDLRTALGRADVIEPDLAHDGLREVADVVYPRQVRLERIEPLASTLVLAPTDAEPVTIGAGPEVVVRGPADELLRLLWHRADTDDPAARALLAVALTP